MSMDSLYFTMISISSIIKLFYYFEVSKGHFDSFIVTFLHLYFQNYIVMEKME
jgi:hypothetical protein